VNAAAAAKASPAMTTGVECTKVNSTPKDAPGGADQYPPVANPIQQTAHEMGVTTAPIKYTANIRPRRRDRAKTAGPRGKKFT